VDKSLRFWDVRKLDQCVTQLNGEEEQRSSSKEKSEILKRTSIRCSKSKILSSFVRRVGKVDDLLFLCCFVFEPLYTAHLTTCLWWFGTCRWMIRLLQLAIITQSLLSVRKQVVFGGSFDHGMQLGVEWGLFNDQLASCGWDSKVAMWPQVFFVFV
jgi:hypothetical protein